MNSIILYKVRFSHYVQSLTEYSSLLFGYIHVISGPASFFSTPMFVLVLGI